MKFDIRKYTRDNIATLLPYSSARDEYDGEPGVFLDANENNLASLLLQYNRYPDPTQLELKKAIAEIKNVDKDQIFLGNGSDECIDIIYRCFCRPGKDNVIICPPTYGMYEVAANINDIEVRKVILSDGFILNLQSIKNAKDENTKILWLCNPNNPTGNILLNDENLNLVQDFPGLVIIDEAYIDFSSGTSFLTQLKNYPNLIILQTFSKAWGLAGLRLGMAFACSEIVQVLNKVKPPYNINQYTQTHVLNSLKNKVSVEISVKNIISYREQMARQLEQLLFVEKVYSSETNFLLVRFREHKKMYMHLLNEGIIVRDRSNQVLCNGCLRITIGTAEENQLLIKSIRTYQELYEKTINN